MDQDSCTSTSDEANVQLDRELQRSEETTRKRLSRRGKLSQLGFHLPT